jgi:hypothetical protein
MTSFHGDNLIAGHRTTSPETFTATSPQDGQ